MPDGDGVVVGDFEALLLALRADLAGDKGLREFSFEDLLGGAAARRKFKVRVAGGETHDMTSGVDCFLDEAELALLG